MLSFACSFLLEFLLLVCIRIFVHEKLIFKLFHHWIVIQIHVSMEDIMHEVITMPIVVLMGIQVRMIVVSVMRVEIFMVWLIVVICWINIRPIFSWIVVIMVAVMWTLVIVLFFM